ncbi:MAG: CBM2 domain fused to hydrolase of the alpha/beta superfamily [Candidatus Ozemobacter sibiricus]|uniref:CBM2 domain fused to hydrolase of the alpha/beta superfamily n=1 Tax=Candidatus Ozemobacter sibiricus TaxID=2268124 RepID=A0A367ZJ99_9BACT|nr:MAG: CBM2 domain fused to hydrolase of the alpha/beta superfamily [Candidatus Ozemobacter sibiricus]
MYLIGNHPAIGAWKGSGVALQPAGPGKFRYQGKFPAGTRLEFKFTRGDFGRVEKSAAGHELPNRTLEVTGPGPVVATFRVAAWADLIEPPAPTITGKYQIWRNFPSRFLGHRRTITILLPRSYDDPAARERRYPVLYMHDGNNLFDPAQSFGGVDWGVDETVDELTRTGELPELIVVGVANTAARLEEYTPFPDPRHGGGKGDLYGRFLIEELKPAVDARLRTRPEAAATALGGSSLGGLISLYLGLKHPEVFGGGLIVMSPSFWWAGGRIIPWAVEQRGAGGRAPLWVDIGLAEGEEALSFCRKFDRAWCPGGIAPARYCYREVPQAGHHEAAWRARFAQPLLHLFGTRAGRASHPSRR